jgi:hypothetical protein
VIPIRFTWRKLGSLGSQHRVALRLTDAGGRSWASRDSRPQGGDASFTALSPGERLTDHHGLLVPAGTPPGDYQLRLSVVSQLDDRPLDLLDAGGQPQGVEALLTSIQVVPPATPLEAEVLPIQHPVTADFEGKVRLLGYSLSDGPFRAGEGLKFSLFWQALADGSQPYVVFAQLQDETGHAGRPACCCRTPTRFRCPPPCRKAITGWRLACCGPMGPVWWLGGTIRWC